MQTITINIQDNFMQDFLAIIEQYKDKIQINFDKNLRYDPYFYQRQKELQQIRKNIKNGVNQLISFEEFENRVDNFEKKLELKYAN